MKQTNIYGNIHSHSLSAIRLLSLSPIQYYFLFASLVLFLFPSSPPFHYLSVLLDTFISHPWLLPFRPFFTSPSPFPYSLPFAFPYPLLLFYSNKLSCLSLFSFHLNQLSFPPLPLSLHPSRSLPFLLFLDRLLIMFLLQYFPSNELSCIVSIFFLCKQWTRVCPHDHQRPSPAVILRCQTFRRWMGWPWVFYAVSTIRIIIEDG